MAELFLFPGDEDRFWRDATRQLEVIALRCAGTRDGIGWACNEARQLLRDIGLPWQQPIAVTPDDLRDEEAVRRLLARSVQAFTVPLFGALLLAELELFMALSANPPISRDALRRHLRLVVADTPAADDAAGDTGKDDHDSPPPPHREG